MSPAVKKAMTVFQAGVVNARAKSGGWTPRRLRTFDDGKGLVLSEAIDGRWLDEHGVSRATTGPDDWPADADGRPLDGCVGGSGLAEWERKLIADDTKGDA